MGVFWGDVICRTYFKTKEKSLNKVNSNTPAEAVLLKHVSVRLIFNLKML